MATSKRKSFAQQIGQKVDQTLAKEVEDKESTQEDITSPVMATEAVTIVEEVPVSDLEITDDTVVESEEIKEIEFKKFTVPLRTDQLDDLADQLWDLGYKYRVDISKASLIRLALDRVLDNLKSDPEAVLHALYRLEQKELAMNEDRRKYSVSKGLMQYVEHN